MHCGLSETCLAFPVCSIRLELSLPHHPSLPSFKPRALNWCYSVGPTLRHTAWRAIVTSGGLLSSMTHKQKAESCQQLEDHLPGPSWVEVRGPRLKASLFSPQWCAAHGKGQDSWRCTLSPCPCSQPTAGAAEGIQGTLTTNGGAVRWWAEKTIDLEISTWEFEPLQH